MFHHQSSSPAKDFAVSRISKKRPLEVNRGQTGPSPSRAQHISRCSRFSNTLGFGLELLKRVAYLAMLAYFEQPEDNILRL